MAWDRDRALFRLGMRGIEGHPPLPRSEFKTPRGSLLPALQRAQSEVILIGVLDGYERDLQKLVPSNHLIQLLTCLWCLLQSVQFMTAIIYVISKDLGTAERIPHQGKARRHCTFEWL